MNWFDRTSVGRSPRSSQAARRVIAGPPEAPFRARASDPSDSLGRAPAAKGRREIEHVSNVTKTDSRRRVDASLRWLGALGIALFALVSTACKRKEATEASPSAAPSATPEAPVAPPPRCAPAKDATTFAIRGRQKPLDEAEAGIDLPYAAEVGTAAARAGGFALGALRYDDGAPHALVALSDGEGKHSQFVELGRVHGPADPPQVASRGDEVFVAVVGSDAAGPTLRLARLDARAPNVASSLTWCAEVQQGRDDSSAFSIAVRPSEPGGVLVWDEYDSEEERAVVRSIAWSGEQCGKVRSPTRLSPAGADAEAPRVVARSGGYWLAWLAPERAASSPAADATRGESPEGSPKSSADLESVVDLVPRGLVLAPLDTRGELAGEPRRVTEAGAHVVAFELTATSDGSALLAWRDDPTAPGAEGRAVSLAWIALDGSVARHRLEDERFAAGAPMLSVDARGVAWLAVASADSEVLLGVATKSGVAELEPEPRLASRQLLAAHDGRVLFAEPRGLDATLGVLRCTPRAR